MSQSQAGSRHYHTATGFHLYADNTHLNINFEVTKINRLLSLRRNEQCVNYVHAWMVDNQLKVNDNKTVALVLSPRNNRATHNITVIKTGECMGNGGRAVQRRTVNRGDDGSIPPTAVSKLRQYRPSHICLCFSEAGGPFYMLSMPGKVKNPTQGVNV